MTRFPVIVGFGGYNAAGRSSFHQGFQRMVIDSLSETKRRETLLGLATMMGVVSCEDGQYKDRHGSVFTAEEVFHEFGPMILDETLVRYFEQPSPPDHFDSWYDRIAVKSAGQLPTGFNPGEYYRSQFHPKGLQLSVMAASDAVRSIGIPWDTILDHITPDQVAVYSSSAMAQMDEHGYQGLMQSRQQGKRITAKQLPLGLNSMPTDFINAYVLGSVGATGTNTGACASFLYNLRQGVDDIQSRRRRVVLVGNSEAPLTQEIIDGYAAMSALATDVNLKKLDSSERPDHQRASRPFSDNCGFTLAESAQYVVLMDDELAMTLGAQVHGAVTDVFVNADGFKRSISSPGAGNYITLAKSVASAQAILGAEAVQQRSWLQAHGSSTPQNRVTESAIFDRVARAFDIENWPVTAIKSYVGHSLAPASGDQMVATLGSFHHQLLPGIKTIDRVADDVHAGRLSISNVDVEADMDVAFINSKGFGGNNATAVVLSPSVSEQMLAKRYGGRVFNDYQAKRERTLLAADAYHQRALQGDLAPIYKFGEGVIDEAMIDLSSDKIQIPGFKNAVDLNIGNPFEDMVESA
ncbi:MAG: beta-ketoacyl synthase [Pseudomonadales bacterium]|nr:beta-ketoacyl synthase [Pseudomonadales bacterium]